MNIIAKSNTVDSPIALYALTQSPDRQKLTAVKGKTLELESWVLYTDVTSKGDEQTLLALSTSEGETFCTNSTTFCRDFKNAVDMFAEFGAEFHEVAVVSGTSKNGREFISCKVVS